MHLNPYWIMNQLEKHSNRHTLRPLDSILTLIFPQASSVYLCCPETKCATTIPPPSHVRCRRTCIHSQCGSWRERTKFLRYLLAQRPRWREKQWRPKSSSETYRNSGQVYFCHPLNWPFTCCHGLNHPLEYKVVQISSTWTSIKYCLHIIASLIIN